MAETPQEKARRLRPVIESLATTQTDEAALESVELFPLWAVGAEYAVGDRVRDTDDGALYKCLQSHTSQADWTPSVAVSLWAKVLAGQGGTDIGEWVQPDSTNPYMAGDMATYNGHTYRSTIDNNVWAPDVYGWELVE